MLKNFLYQSSTTCCGLLMFSVIVFIFYKIFLTEKTTENIKTENIANEDISDIKDIGGEIIDVDDIDLME